MRLGHTRWLARWLALRRLSVTLAVAAGARAAAAVPAAAQTYYWTDQSPRYQPAPSRDFFSFPFFGGAERPPPVADFTKAPPPRKLETPPTSTIVVIGDSMADWLGYGLDEIYGDQPDVGVERIIRATAGLIRYDPKNEALDWPQVVKDALAAEKPNAIVVMLGLNDRVPLRDGPPPQKNGAPPAKAADQPAKNAAEEKTAPVSATAPQDNAAGNETPRPVAGGVYEFHSDQWADLYVKRIDEMIAALKSKGVPVVWVGLPAIRGPKSTSEMAYLDELYRERAERAGIVYVDVWDGFVDDQGRYAVDGPDFEGQIRRLRTYDGVHFTKAGAATLASYVDLELRRVMSNHTAPVALPEATSTAKPGAPRPDIGPVLPLTASVGEGGESGDLLGAGAHSAPAATDPLAAEVLHRGDPIAAVAGRADDFSWPRPADDASAAPEPVSLAPAAPPNKAAAAPDDAKKTAAAKKDAKTKPLPEPAAAKPRRSPSVELDGAPVPPKDVGRGY